MKVLRDARDEEWAVTKNCRGCGSSLEVTREDIKTGMFGAMGDYDKEFYVECPVCENHVIVSSELTYQMKTIVELGGTDA